MSTANGMYKYDEKFFDIKLSDWVNMVHKKYSEEMKWKYNELKQGQFGYDNLAVSIGYTFYGIDKNSTALDIARLIHKGWAINYTYWRDNKPYETNTFFKKPYQALGDERRNKCALSSYDELDEEEKNKDMIIALFFHKFLNNKS